MQREGLVTWSLSLSLSSSLPPLSLSLTLPPSLPLPLSRRGSRRDRNLLSFSLSTAAARGGVRTEGAGQARGFCGLFRSGERLQHSPDREKPVHSIYSNASCFLILRCYCARRRARVIATIKLTGECPLECSLARRRGSGRRWASSRTWLACRAGSPSPSRSVPPHSGLHTTTRCRRVTYSQS